MIHEPIERLVYERPWPSTPRLPVPRWGDLPGHALRDLATFQADFFRMLHDDHRLTLLVLSTSISGPAASTTLAAAEDTSRPTSTIMVSP